MRYRVGTFSTGLLFITIGLLLFLQHWFEIKFTTLFFTWWPIFLIALGAELLYYLYKQKQQTTEKISYDIFSIFIVTLFAFASIFVYSVKASGILDFIDQRVLTASFNIDSPVQQVANLENIDKIIVTGDASRITIKEGLDNHLIIDPAYRFVSAGSLAEAEFAVQDLIKLETVGSTLFIKLNNFDLSSPFHATMQQYATLYLPADKQLDVQFDRADIHLENIKIESNWSINTRSGGIVLTTQTEPSFSIEAFSNHGKINTSEHWTSLEEDRSKAIYEHQEAHGQLVLKSDYGLINFNTKH